MGGSEVTGLAEGRGFHAKRRERGAVYRTRSEWKEKLKREKTSYVSKGARDDWRVGVDGR